MHAAVALHVEGRREDPPGERAAVEILHHARLKLEEELLNPGVLQTWLPGAGDVVLPRTRPRKKAESRIERVAECLHRCGDVPKVIRIVDGHAPSVLSATNAFAVGRRRPRAEREVFVA